MEWAASAMAEAVGTAERAVVALPEAATLHAPVLASGLAAADLRAVGRGGHSNPVG